MSKELLKALVDVLDDLKLRKNLSEDDTLNISDSVLMRAEEAIENYIAQPEHIPAIRNMVEQEHVAWMYEWDSPTTGQPTCRYVNMGKDKPNVEANFLARNFTPLYTSPQPEPFKPDWANYRQGVADSKREPLSEAEIFNAWIPSKATPCVHSFKAGVKFAEKEHGIGVDYE